MTRCAEDVSIVIPTTGPSPRLRLCLESISRQAWASAHVVVVGQTEALSPQDCGPAYTWLVCPLPWSFARAVNQGIAATTSRWVLLLNDDVQLAPAFLEQLASGTPQDDRIGMICGKLLRPDGRTIDSTGQFLSRARTAHERGYGQIDRGQFDQPGAVFSVPGACALYRRAMLDALAAGGQCFDETLGTYLEDLELGWRAQRAGWRASYVPTAVAYHARGATAKTKPPRWRWLRRYYLPWLPPALQARYVRNRYRLIRRHDTLSGLLRNAPWLLAYELRMWGYLLSVSPQVLRHLCRPS